MNFENSILQGVERSNLEFLRENFVSSAVKLDKTLKDGVNKNAYKAFMKGAISFCKDVTKSGLQEAFENRPDIGKAFADTVSGASFISAVGGITAKYLSVQTSVPGEPDIFPYASLFAGSAVMIGLATEFAKDELLGEVFADPMHKQKTEGKLNVFMEDTLDDMKNVLAEFSNDDEGRMTAADMDKMYVDIIQNKPELFARIEKAANLEKVISMHMSQPKQGHNRKLGM